MTVVGASHFIHQKSGQLKMGHGLMIESAAWIHRVADMTFGIKVSKKWIYLMYDKLSLYWSFDRSHWLNTAFCVCLRIFHLSIWEIFSWLRDYPDWPCCPLKSAKGCKPVYMYSIHSTLSWFKLFERFLMNRKVNSKMFSSHQKQIK